jgi:hypothetical protein
MEYKENVDEDGTVWHNKDRSTTYVCVCGHVCTKNKKRCHKCGTINPQNPPRGHGQARHVCTCIICNARFLSFSLRASYCPQCTKERALIQNRDANYRKLDKVNPDRTHRNSKYRKLTPEGNTNELCRSN